MEWSNKIGCGGLIIILFIIYIIGSLNPDNSSSIGNTSTHSYSNTHTCDNCGKQYSGPGYMHLLDDCQLATGEFANLNNSCSRKCCQERWIRENQAKQY